MGITELTESMGWKKFMAKLYGWGASVVIIGALFKIQHWPGAGIMLTIGLGTEALIFFFSAFEPMHKDYAAVDWTIVYPELAIPEEEREDESGHGNKLAKKDNKKGLTAELDKMLEDAKIGPELIKSLGEGLSNLSVNAKNMGDVSKVVVDTNDFSDKIKKASVSAEQLDKAFLSNSQAINKETEVTNAFASSLTKAADDAKKFSEVTNLNLKTTESYANNMNEAVTSLNGLKSAYKQATDDLMKSAKAIEFSGIDGQSYGKQIQIISKNLEALNSVYELQLKSVKTQVDNTDKVNEGVNKFMSTLQSTSDDTQKFKDELRKLNKNIAALNNVYGNMLTAMSIKG